MSAQGAQKYTAVKISSQTVTQGNASVLKQLSYAIWLYKITSIGRIELYHTKKPNKS